MVGDSLVILLGCFGILGVYHGRWGFLRILEDSWRCWEILGDFGGFLMIPLGILLRFCWDSLGFLAFMMVGGDS